MWLEVMGRILSRDDICLQGHDGDRNSEEANYRVVEDWLCLVLHSEIPYIKVQDPEHDKGEGSLVVSL